MNLISNIYRSILRSKIYYLRSKLRTRRRKILAATLAILILLTSFQTLLFFREAEAAWFDDSYAYRQPFNFTHNAALSAQAVTFSLDTAELITAGVMQADCDDTRFTDINGLVLTYELTGTCNNAATTYEVVFPTVINGTNPAYVYYGNPSALSASVDTSGYTALTPSGGDPSITTRTNEEKGPSPSAYWKFDEGYGRAANDATSNQNNLKMSPLTGIEQQINIITQEYSTSSSTQVPTDNSLGLIQWDATKYSGASVYFEAVGYDPAWNGYTSLYSESGSQITEFEHNCGQGSWCRTRSAELSSSLTNGINYTVRIRHSNGNATAIVKAARFIIVQSDSSGISDTQTQIEVGNTQSQSSSTATQLTDKKIYYYDSSTFTPSPTTTFEATMRSSPPTIEQQINIMDQEFSTTSTSYAPTDNSLGLVRWDGTKYSGDTVYFEAVGLDPSFDGRAALFDEGGTQVTNSEVHFNCGQGSYCRIRSAALTLTDSTNYTVRLKHSNAVATSFVKAARLVVVQTDTTKITDTETQVEVGNNETTTATSNTQLADKKIYRYTSAEFSPAPTVYFEATLSNDTGGSIAYASLYTNGATCTTQVTSSEVSVTGTTWTRVRSAAITLTTGTDYMVCIRASANTARIANAKIILDQTAAGGITDIELVHQEINTLNTDTDSTYTSQDFLNRFNPDLESAQGGPSLMGGVFTYFYEATLKAASTTTAYAQLYNTTDSSAISSSEVSTTSTSYARARSSDISSGMPAYPQNSAKVFDTQLKNSTTNTASASTTWLIIQVSSLATGGVTTYADIYNLTDGIQVSGSEISATASTWNRITSSSLTLTSGKEYVVRLRSSVNNVLIYLSNARIVHTQSSGSVSAVEIIRQQVNTLKTDTDSTYTEQQYDNEFDPTNFSGGTFTEYFEATLKTSTATTTTAYADLYNDTDNASITGSEVTTTSATYTRVRSADITSNMPSTAKTMDTRLKNSAASGETTSVSSTWVIIQATAITAGGDVARWQTEDLCVFGKCLFFDGVDDVAFAQNADSIDFDLGLSGAVTFQGWVRVNSDGEANQGEIFDKGTNTYLRITNEGTDGLADLEASLNLATTNATVTVTNGITLNKWHQIVMVYTDDGDDEITIYIDSVNQGSSTNGVGSPAADSNAFLLGGDSSNNFNGFIDEFKIYDEERTEAQIKTDFIKGTSSLYGASAAYGIRDYSFLSEGLVGYWKMDDAGVDAEGETSTESSGIGNNGTLYGDDGAGDNGTGMDCTVTGKFGTGCDFDGVDDYIATGAKNIGNTEEATVSLWVKSDSWETGSSTPLFGWHYYPDGNGVVNWYGSINLRTTIGGTVTHVSFDSTSNLGTNTWRHLIATYDGNTVKTYVDGQFKTSNSSYSGTWNWQSGQDYNFAGDIPGGDYSNITLDEVRVYNRALSGAEVSALYNWAPNPVLYYDLDENTGTSTVNDKSGNENAGTMTGTMTSDDWVPGKFGSALNFDGTDDAITISTGSDSDVDFNGSETFSGGAWVYVDTMPGASNQDAIITKWDETSTLRAYRLVVENDDADTTGNFQVEIYDESANQAISATGANDTVSENTWYYVSFTFNGGIAGAVDDLNLYTNGVFTDGNAANASFLGLEDVAVDFSIADYDATDAVSNNTAFAGVIDDAKVYNYIRTGAQIIEDMNAGHPAPGSPIGSAVGYWKFDEGYGDTAYDSGTGGSNGNLAAGTTCPQAGDSACPAWTQSGRFDKALNFDTSGTTDDYVENNTQLVSAYPFTMSAWINTTSGARGVVFDLVDASVANTYYDIYVDNDGTAALSAASASAADVINSTTTVNDGSWQYIAGVFTSATDRKLYVNGILEATGTVSRTYSSLIDRWSIGRRGDSTPSTYFNGFIDEVKIYNFELTAAQIKGDMNKGSAASFGDVANQDNEGFGGNAPILWYKMDENTGTGTDAVKDTSGNDKSGDMQASMTEADWVPVTGAPRYANGLGGSALNFDGQTNDYVVTDALFSGDQTNGSFAAWVNFDTFATTDRTIFFRGFGDPLYPRLFYDTSQDDLQLQWKLDTVTLKIEVASFSSSYSTGEWIHVAATFDAGADEVKLYVNGVLKGTETTTGTDFDGSTDTTYLGYDSNLAVLLDGKLDDFRVYDYTLTPAQVAYVFNRGGPLGYWKLDDCTGTTATDNGSGGNNGTISANSTGSNTSVGTCSSSAGDEMWDNGTTGKRNSSLHFDGTNDEIIITDTSELRFDTTNEDFSVFAWVKRNSTTSSDVIISKEDADNDGWTIFIRSSGSNDQLACSIDSTNGVYGTDGIMENTDWHHLGCTFDRDGNMTLYIDGVSVSTANISGNSMATTIDLHVGERSYDSGNTMDGQIDELKIFNYVLTADQVKRDFNNGAQFFGPATGPP